MKLIVPSLLTALLLCTGAHAEEAAAPSSKAARNVALKVQLYEVVTETAVATGLDTADAMGEDGASSTRFNIIRPEQQIGQILDRLAVSRQGRLLVETQLGCASGYPFSLTRMMPLADASVEAADAVRADAQHPQFPGMMGYSFTFTPTVDEAGYIIMPLYLQLQSPGIERQFDGLGEVPAMSQAVESTLRVGNGATICVANVMPQDFRLALSGAFQAALAPDEAPVFPAQAPVPGTTTYLLITATAISEN